MGKAVEKIQGIRMTRAIVCEEYYQSPLKPSNSIEIDILLGLK